MKRAVLTATMLLAAAAAHGEATAIVNVNVLPMTSEKVLRAQTVVVIDGKIGAIGAVDDTPVPDDATVVDGTDRFLMPGLAEMHGHVPGASSESLDRVLGLYVANGITTVRGMLGEPSHLELRQAILDGRTQGPRLITSGPSFNGESVDGTEDAVRMVREQKEAGYDFLKIHPGLSRAEFDAVAATAHQLGIPFAGHVPEDVGVRAALQAGIATIDHLDGYLQELLPANVDPSGGLGGFFGVLVAGAAEESKIEPLAKATADAGVWIVPTESLFEHVTSAVDSEELAAWPEMRYMPAATVEEWKERKRSIVNDVGFDPAIAARAIELRRELIVALHDAGAGLLLGSDSPQIFNVPGFSLHRELGYLVDAGLSPYEALKTGTVNPAVFFGTADRFGSIEPGLDADLLLLDDNPLADIVNIKRIHGVMLRGQWLTRQDLDRILLKFCRNEECNRSAASGI